MVAGSLTEGMAALGTERGSQWQESFKTMHRKPSVAPLHLRHRPEADVIEACRKAGRTTERAGDVSKNLSSQPFLARFPLFANTDAQGTR